MPTGSTVFVDTNVLVYAEDVSEPDKKAQCHEWLKALWSARVGRVSTQVLNEYYVAVTQKIPKKLTQGDARAKVRRMQQWEPWHVDHQTVETAWAMEARYGFHYWDALIIASASHAGCRWLLTEDLQHDQQIGTLTVVNPFRTQPSELLPPNA
jgi:predicted nucleic acid-binding protein